MPTKTRERRSVTINLRATPTQRTFIDRAAKTTGKNRSDFMLEAACHQASDVLSDQRYFFKDEKTFKRFEIALDHPPKANQRIRRLLTTPSPWDE